MRIIDMIAESFFDGFGPGALFVRTSLPGAPKKVFASSRSEVLLNELAVFLSKAEPEDLPEVNSRLEPLREWMRQKAAASQSTATRVSPFDPQRMSEELLPPTEDLVKLTEGQTIAVVDAVDRLNRRKHGYAVTAMLCGTISFCALWPVSSILSFKVTAKPQAFFWEPPS